MDPEDSDGPDQPGLVAKVGGAIAIAALLKNLTDRDIDSSRPSSTMWTERTVEVRDRALQLAKAGREDAAAIQELKDTAGRRPKELRRAAATFRVNGWNVEDLVSNRANRLLLAAACDQPIESVADVDTEWFRSLEALQTMPLSDSFSELAASEPTIADLERMVQRDAEQQDSLNDDYDQRAWDRIYDALNTLLGPESRAVSPLGRTNLAWYIARDHLRAIAGLPSLQADTEE